MTPERHDRNNIFFKKSAETGAAIREKLSCLPDAIRRGRAWPGLDTLPKAHAPENIVPGCMVLEGGSFRGNYTAGVLDVLMERGINLQTIVGTSAGALNGMNYTAGEIGRSIRINLTYRHDPRYIGVPAVAHGQSVLGLRFIVEDVCDEVPFDFERFDRPDRRFVATAMDCLTGEARYFEKGRCGEMFKAVRASASLPYLSAMVKVEGTPCLDGGLTVKIPYQWALDGGFEKIIVVRTRDAAFRRKPEDQKACETARRFYHNYPKVAEGICTQSVKYNVACDELDALAASGRILMLAPSAPVTLSTLEGNLDHIAELYRLGRMDTIRRLPEIRRYLGI